MRKRVTPMEVILYAIFGASISWATPYAWWADAIFVAVVIAVGEIAHLGDGE